MKTNYVAKTVLLCVLFSALITGQSILAQPSGGPYGPVLQNYQIPQVSGKIYYVAVDGKADNTGESLAKPTTIEAAIERVVTGDAIIMRGGIYRTGDLNFNQGITIQSYADEQPVIKGSYVAKDWQKIGDKLWKIKWDRFFPGSPDSWWSREKYGMFTPLHIFNNDMVFVDGKILNSAGNEAKVDFNSFYIDYANQSIFIGIDPTDHLVEITAFNRGLHRVITECHGKVSDKKGFVLRGIKLMHYAYCAVEIDGYEPQGLADPSTFGKDVVGTVIENCSMAFCGRVGIYLRGDKTVLRNCKVHDTTTEGVYLLSSSDCLLEKNIFMRNNIEDIIGYFPAAVKIFNQTQRTVCNDNLVFDQPLSNGIWYDVGNVDGVFINNWIEGTGSNKGEFSTERPWPSHNGFFFEISKGAICAGNVFVNCDHGLWVLNSSDVKIYQNTFINSTACFGRDGRSAVGDHFGWHPSTGPDVDKRYGHVFVNNLMFGDNDFQRPLLFVWQPANMCAQFTIPQLKQLDYNLYSQINMFKTMPMILWSPGDNEKCQLSLESPADIHKLFPDYSTHSRVLNKGAENLFKNAELGNYEIMNELPEMSGASMLPTEISILLGLKKNTQPYFGAYPIEK